MTHGKGSPGQVGSFSVKSVSAFKAQQRKVSLCCRMGSGTSGEDGGESFGHGDSCFRASSLAPESSDGGGPEEAVTEFIRNHRGRKFFKTLRK